MKFDGFRKLYLESSEDDREEESRLPELAEGQALDLRELRPEQHFTQPPPRYSEASLVKELEERGIGRPSTYASILQTLTESGRDYTRLRQKRLVPTDTGEVTTDFLLRYFGDHFMDHEFTSDMEVHLDEIAEGKLSYRPVVEQFYIPLQDRLNKAGEVPKEEVTTEPTDEICPDCGHALVIKLGRRGKFLACTNYPECRFTKSLPGEEEEKQELLDEKCPECGSQLQRRFGRYGPFVGCSNYPECKYIKKRKAEPTGAPCPRCQDEPCAKCKEGGATPSEVPAERQRAGVAQGRGELVERFSRRGKFFGCSHYPACRFTQNEDPRKEPAAATKPSDTAPAT
jgi:DNA topoisomerase-1